MKGAREFDIKNANRKHTKQVRILREVMVVKTDLELNIETSVKRKAQVQSRDQSNINNLTMNIETKVEINMEKKVSDTISLMDGRFIVVECLGKVNLLTSDGKPQKQLPITGEAWSVTQINQNTIAISYPKEAIKIFNLENETENRSGNIHRDLSGPRGLCADTYGNIIVADWRSNRVIVISKDGQESKELIGEEGGLKDPQCIRFKIMTFLVLSVITNAVP
ncbi:TRIM2_3 [Mytilus edulis]|uniref:TRIM2_3 n=1 Tax=Mytilus edulis TaxID=6550 RepID=A0A8S3Q7F3_MYTED|nr:TRIM2_3 [Mytilus edulis]